MRPIKLLRFRSFARLFLASFISEVGNKLHRIALLVWVYQQTGQALWVSLVLGIQLVALVGVGLPLAAWADHQERRRLLVASDLLRALLVPLIPILGRTSLLPVVVLVFLLEVVRSLYNPVASALLPELVPEEELDWANGLFLFTRRFSEVAFVGLAGLFVGWVGPAPAFWVDAATFLVSASILLGLPTFLPRVDGEEPFWDRVRAGIRHLWYHPTLRWTVGTLSTAAAFGSVESVLGVVLALKVLQVGSKGFGILEATIALGSVLGTLSVAHLTRNLSRERLFLWSLLIFGLFEASVGAFPYFRWVLIAYFITGYLNLAFVIPARSLLQVHTPMELRTRVFAAFNVVIHAAVLLGTLLGGALEGPLGAPRVFLGAGLGVALVACLVFLRGGIPEPQVQWSPERTEA